MIRTLPAIALTFLTPMASTAAPKPPELPPFAATVVVEFNAGRVIRIKAEGMADPFSKRRATADDPVRIASISKLIVAMGVDTLVRSGKIDLNRDVSEYLGWTLRNPKFPDTPITLSMLMSHTSSLTDNAGYLIPAGKSVRSYAQDPKAWDSEHAPGTWFHYTNFNSPIIATVMEAVTGERFDRLMRRLVFDPAGIDACFGWSTCSDQKVARAVVLTSETGSIRRDDLKGKRPECDVYPAEDGSCDISQYQPGVNGGMFSPQGGVRISMNDLAKIGQLLLKRHGGMLASEIKAGLYNRDSTILAGNTEKGFFCRYTRNIHVIGASTGAGCKDNPFGDARVRIGHAGEAYGVRTGLWVDHTRKTGVVFFTTAVPDDNPSGRSAFSQREERVITAKTARPPLQGQSR
jgi:CubicO group peptidase (beta-lactamase class C family)